MLVEFYRAVWEGAKHNCVFAAPAAELMVCDEEQPEKRTLQVQYQWEAESAMAGSGYCEQR